MWRIEDPQGNEAAKIKYEIVPYTRGKGLDLGCGPFKAYPHFIGVDNGHHWGQGDAGVNHDCENLSIFASQSLDFVFSSHLLEHIQDWKAALREWWRVIKPGGHLVMYLPHRDLYPNIGQPGANPDHKHDFDSVDIMQEMKELGGFDLVRNERREQGREYSFFQVYKKLPHKKDIFFTYSKDKPKKTVCVCRYGAIGDMVMISSIFPLLKAQGYHVTLMTVPNGELLLRHDPNIDEFIIQDPDQVPNGELWAYWGEWAKKYDKFINLCEIMEGSLLAMPGRTTHTWPYTARQKYLDVNYQELLHDVCEVPHKFNVKFYPTPEERKWAEKEKAKHGKVVLWSMAGSSIHKVWPYMDTIIARLLLETDCKVVLVGDVYGELLEQGWEKEPRVLCRSGKWDIRKTLAFAQLADLVIGPETGVVNAVAQEKVPKIITLSHSSIENLTKHWVNTFSLTPDNVGCYPCHMLHHGDMYCKVDDNRIAECQKQISFEDMWTAIKSVEALWPQVQATITQ